MLKTQIMDTSLFSYMWPNDMLILGSNNYIITTAKKMLSSKFNMKDLGVVDVILGIKIF